MNIFISLFVFLSIFICLSGCTYSITMVHTQGEAADVVDETATPSTSVTPTLTIPAKML